MNGEVRHEHESVVADRLKDVSDALGRLVKEHVELAKAEVQQNVKKAGRDVAVSAAGGVLALVGYLIVMIAIGYFIGDALGDGWGMLIIGGANLLLGGGLAAMFAMRLRDKDKPGLPQTTRELGRDRVFLGQVGHIVRDEPRT